MKISTKKRIFDFIEMFYMAFTVCSLLTLGHMNMIVKILICLAVIVTYSMIKESTLEFK